MFGTPSHLTSSCSRTLNSWRNRSARRSLRRSFVSRWVLAIAERRSRVRRVDGSQYSLRKLARVERLVDHDRLERLRLRHRLRIVGAADEKHGIADALGRQL